MEITKVMREAKKTMANVYLLFEQAEQTTELFISNFFRLNKYNDGLWEKGLLRNPSYARDKGTLFFL